MEIDLPLQSVCLHISSVFCFFCSALCLTSQILIPLLLSDEAFPDAQTVALHLLHLSGDEEEMQMLKSDIEDSALSLLYRVHRLDVTQSCGFKNVIQHREFTGDGSHRPGTGFP